MAMCEQPDPQKRKSPNENQQSHRPQTLAPADRARFGVDLDATRCAHSAPAED